MSNSEVGTTKVCSADALTDTYALMDDELSVQDGTNKWLWLYAETQTTLEIVYTTGAAETNNYVEFYIEYGSGAVSGPPNKTSTMTWVRETMEYFDDSADQILLEEWTYRIDGAAAGTAYTKRIQLPVCAKAIRIYAKEVGVAANYGTLTIKANTVAAGAGFYNRHLQTVTLEADAAIDVAKWGGTTLTAGAAAADALSNAVVGGLVKTENLGYNGTTWDRIRAGVTTLTATLTGWLNTLPWAIYNAAPTTRTEGQGGPLQADASGNLKVADQSGGGSAGGGNNTYSTEQGDFTATVTDSSYAIVLSVDSIGGQSLTTANFANGILKVQDVSLTPDEWKIIKLDKFTWTSGTKTLDVTSCTGAFPFGTGDVVSLVITGPDKMRNTTTDSQRTTLTRDVSDQYVVQTVVDTTNVADDTYYPSSSGQSTNGYRDLTVTGILIDGAAETTTLTVQVSNLGGTTATDWMTVYVRDDINNTNVNSISATNQTTYYAISAPGIGKYAYYRYKIDTSAASNTVEINEKLTY